MPRSTSAPAAVLPSTPSSGAASKRDFILAQPRSMPARDVVAEAREAGLHISESYVYNLRTQTASGSTAPQPKRGRPPGSKNKSTNASGAPAPAANGKPALPFTQAGSVSPPHSASGDETTFRKLVVQLGVTRADDLIADVRQRLDRLVTGE